jgi:hypothetical protein
MVGAEDIKQYIYYYKATNTKIPMFLGKKQHIKQILMGLL